MLHWLLCEQDKDNKIYFKVCDWNDIYYKADKVAFEFIYEKNNLSGLVYNNIHYAINRPCDEFIREIDLGSCLYTERIRINI